LPIPTDLLIIITDGHQIGATLAQIDYCTAQQHYSKSLYYCTDKGTVQAVRAVQVGDRRSEDGGRKGVQHWQALYNNIMVIATAIAS